MDGVLEELLIALGYDIDEEGQEKLKDFNKGIEKTTKLLDRLIKSAAVATGAITGLVVATTKASDEQGKLAAEIDETVETVDALQFANRRAGGSAEGLSSSLRDLSKRASETARGVGEGVEAFGMLGISVADAQGRLKPTSQLLFEVSERFQSLDNARQIEFAEKLGLSGSLRLLQQGPEAIAALTAEARELGVTTAEDAALSARFQDSLVDLWQIIRQISRTLTKALVPFLQDVADRLTEWWKVNRDLIEQDMPRYLELATKAAKIFAAAMAALIAVRIFTGIAGIIGLLSKMNVALALSNLLVLALPALIGAAIAAIALLAEDALIFFEGGNSFIGEMLEKYPQWEKQIRTIAAVFATIGDVTMMIFDGWKQIIDLFTDGKVGQFLQDLPGFLDDVTGFGDFRRRAGDSISNTIDNVTTSVTNIPGNILDAITPDFSGLNLLSPIQGSVPPIRSGDNFQVDRVDINIPPTITDPVAVGREVRVQFTQALQDLSTPVEE